MMRKDKHLSAVTASILNDLDQIFSVLETVGSCSRGEITGGQDTLMDYYHLNL